MKKPNWSYKNLRDISAVSIFFVSTVTIMVLGCSHSQTQELIIYSGRSESLVAPIIEQFASTSGIEVRVKYASTGQLGATLLEEGDRSPADVFFAQDPGGLGTVENLLSTLPSSVTNDLPDWAVSDQNLWVGVTGRQRVVVYNTESLSNEDLPSTIWDFTKPEWKGRIGWAPTNASFQSMITGMLTLWGEDRTKEWIKGIIDNDPHVYPKNTPIVVATGSGEIDVGFVNHYYLNRVIDEQGEGFPAANHFLDAGDPGALILVAGVGIFESSENKDEATKFIEFLISKQAQEYFTNETFEFPVIVGSNANNLEITSVPPSRLTYVQPTQAILRELGVIP